MMVSIMESSKLLSPLSIKDMPSAPRQMQQTKVPICIKNFLPFRFINFIVTIAAKNGPPLSPKVAAPIALTLSVPIAD